MCVLFHSLCLHPLFPGSCHPDFLSSSVAAGSAFPISIPLSDFRVSGSIHCSPFRSSCFWKGMYFLTHLTPISGSSLPSFSLTETADERPDRKWNEFSPGLFSHSCSFPCLMLSLLLLLQAHRLLSCREKRKKRRINERSNCE